MMQWKNWSANLALLLLCTACNDETFESPVPAGYVRYDCNILTVNIAMGQGHPQVSLESPGGYVRCWDPTKRQANQEWGVGGLLLVHGYDSEANRFYAFDLACPYCYATHATSETKLHRLQMSEDGTKALCPDCNSEFGSIFWGSPAPTQGPANQSNYLLRQYKASLLGEKLVVTN